MAAAVVYVNKNLDYKRKREGIVADFACPYCKFLYARQGVNKHITQQHPDKTHMTRAEKEQGCANEIARKPRPVKVAEPVKVQPTSADAEVDEILTRLRLMLSTPTVAPPKPVMVDAPTMVAWQGYGKTAHLPCRHGDACPCASTCQFYHGEKVMTAKPRSI